VGSSSSSSSPRGSISSSPRTHASIVAALAAAKISEERRSSFGGQQSTPLLPSSYTQRRYTMDSSARRPALANHSKRTSSISKENVSPKQQQVYAWDVNVVLKMAANQPLSTDGVDLTVLPRGSTPFEKVMEDLWRSTDDYDGQPSEMTSSKQLDDAATSKSNMKSPGRRRSIRWGTDNVSRRS